MFAGCVKNREAWIPGDGSLLCFELRHSHNMQDLNTVTIKHV